MLNSKQVSHNKDLEIAPLSASLKSKRAMVTGATSGIGRLIALRLARRGVDLFVVARSENGLEKFKSEIDDKYDVSCHIMLCDLSSANEVDGLARALPDLKIDILVNNAGSISYGYFWENDPIEEAGRVYLLTSAPMRLARAVLPGMLDRGFGRILNVASVAGLMTGPYFATYNSSKAFIINFSESLSEELKGTPVTCGCLLPGTTRTGFWDVPRLNEKVDVEENRFVDPGLVANAAVKMIETGADFKIVGAKNVIKQFILRRLVPRTVVNKVLEKHCRDEILLKPKTPAVDYTLGTGDFHIRCVDENCQTAFMEMEDLLPRDMCPHLAHALIPYVTTLSGGGCFPWMKGVDPRAVYAQCPNPSGAVTARVAAEGDRIVAEVSKVRGDCVKGCKPGDTFSWKRVPDIPFEDANLLYEWIIIMTGSGGAGRSPQLRSAAGDRSYTIERRNDKCGSYSKNPCPPEIDFDLRLGHFTHRCRYHKFPKRERYDERNWIPEGLCPELFHAAYPSCLAKIYGGGGSALEEIHCPNAGKALVRIEVDERIGVGTRRAAEGVLRLAGVNTEIPSHRCRLKVIEAEKDCPLEMKAGAIYEFNMGGRRGICPAMFHNAYPTLTSVFRGAEAPWPGLPGHRGCVQCPDDVSNITMYYRVRR